MYMAELPGHPLVPVHPTQGQGHQLDGRPVFLGERLELLLRDGSWVAGRYVWTGDTVEPSLSLDAGLVVPLRPDARLRRL
jgi:hypothetical protein